MWAHLSSLLTWFVGIPGIAGALTFWLLGKERSALVDDHGKEAINFQLTVLVALIGGSIAGVVTLGFGLLVIVPAWIVGGILALIWQIQGAMAASRGQSYRYPMNWRMVR